MAPNIWPNKCLLVAITDVKMCRPNPPLFTGSHFEASEWVEIHRDVRPPALLSEIDCEINLVFFFRQTV